MNLILFALGLVAIDENNSVKQNVIASTVMTVGLTSMLRNGIQNPLKGNYVA